jgi:serine protease inhibitor
MSNALDMRYAAFSVLALTACFHISSVRAADKGNFPDRLNTFGFNLVQRLESSGQRNLLISPASIEIALGMTYAGASGETADAVSRVLGLDGSSREAALKELGDLQAALQNPGPGVTLKVANAVWIDGSIHLNQKFATDLAETFRTKLETVHFDDSTTISRINDWASKATDGKINRLLENPPSPPMLLANAVYFHALWNSPFPKQLTQEQPFHTADGPNRTVEMMRQHGLFRYAKGPGYSALELPYVDNRFAMYCFLSDEEVNGVNAVLEELKKTPWSDFSRTLRPTEGSVALPRFKFEYGTPLNQPLSELGMGIAFSGRRAQFTRIIDGPRRLYIGGVLHKTFVEADEAGTTAAAVTSIQMEATAMMRPANEFNLVFNRPFIAAIVDEKSGAILFVGIIGEP